MPCPFSCLQLEILDLCSSLTRRCNVNTEHRVRAERECYRKCNWYCFRLLLNWSCTLRSNRDCCITENTRVVSISRCSLNAAAAIIVIIEMGVWHVVPSERSATTVHQLNRTFCKRNDHNDSIGSDVCINWLTLSSVQLSTFVCT